MEERDSTAMWWMKAHPLTRILTFLTLCRVGLSDQCTLEIWRGETQIATEDLCQEEIQTEVCTAFAESFNRSVLPFPVTGYSVEKPASLDIITLRNSYVDQNNISWWYPSMSWRWDAPFSDEAKAASQGYFLTWTVDTKNATYCRIFRFNTSSNIRQQKLKFYFTVSYAFPTSNYNVKVYTLPPPSAGEKDDPRTFVQMSAKTTVAYTFTEVPGKWAPSISYRTYTNGTIDVKFTLSPPEFNFTDFDVHVVTSSQPGDSFRYKSCEMEVFTPSKPEGFVRFDNLPSGYYQIVLWVKDPFRADREKCLCWVYVSTGEKDCNNVCGSTSTKFFYLNVTEPPTTTTKPTTTSQASNESAATVRTSPTTITTDNDGIPVQLSKSSPTGNKVAIVLGIVCAVIAVVVLTVFIYRWRHWKAKSYLISVCSRRRQARESIEMQHHPQQFLTLDAGLLMMEGPYLTKKTLYIMSAESHKTHSDAVDCLVNFLQARCHCDVIYPPWSYTHDLGTYEWFQASIAKSCHIVFIDSLAAEKRILAHLGRKVYLSRSCGPDADLFSTGLKHILNNQDARENSVLISFGGKYCQKYLHAPRTYELPDQLSQLLYKIHDLDEKACKSYSVYVENISLSEEGAKLLAAITSAKAYEEDNPSWFEDNFGSPISILQPGFSITSYDSAYHSIYTDRAPSVSTQDSSDAESPSSTTNQPSFSSESSEYDTVSPSLTFSGTDPFPCQNDLPAAPRTFIPPESASQLMCDNLSAALREVNGDDQSEYYPQSQTTPDDQSIGAQNSALHEEELRRDIQPPDSLSQIQVDSISSALRDFNKELDNTSRWEFLSVRL